MAGSSTSTAVTLSVVIPTYNRATVLARCLDALIRQSADPASYEIVVVDDGSTDATRSVAERFLARLPRVQYVQQPNAGPATARNTGLNAASGEIVLFLGDDAIADPDLVRLHVERHRHAGRQAAVLGLIEQEYPERPSPFDRFLEKSGLQFNFDAARQRPNDVPFGYFCTANVSVSRAAALRVGGFDERFRAAAWEDVEFGYRLAKAGVPLLFAPGAKVLHAHPVTLRQYLRRMSIAGKYARLLYQIHPSEEMVSLLSPMLMSAPGYRIGYLRSRLARTVVYLCERLGLAARYPEVLYHSYSIALMYEFNKAFFNSATLNELSQTSAVASHPRSGCLA